MTDSMPDDDFLNFLLHQMENNPDLGYEQRQAVPQDLLTQLIMNKYKLGPTAAQDAHNYALDLRTFSNPREFEGSR